MSELRVNTAGIACLLVLLLAGCGDHLATRRTVQKVGPGTLREQIMAVCRGKFPHEGGVKIPAPDWPASVAAFKPLSVWAEPDGAYLLLESDADGEHGVFLPRILSEKDPVCGPSLKHVKLADGVYWYDRKRG
jgi:hypothetical protein